jgi:predicted ferric reductase
MNTENDYVRWLERYSGWVIIGLFCFIPCVGWLHVAGLAWSQMNVQTFIESLGKLAAIVGFVLFAVNFVLSIRHRILERFFGGLNRVYIAHHLTGAISLILLCFHPLFLAFDYINFQALSSLRYAAEFLLPRAIDFSGTFQNVQSAAALDSGMLALVLLVGLLFVAFFVRLPYQLWLYIHRFLGLAFVFGGLHVLFYTSLITSTPWLEGYMAAWTAIGTGAFIYHTLFGRITIRREPYQVTGVTATPAGIVHINLTPVKRRISFLPGQFIFIRFLWANERDKVTDEIHPFSVSSSPHEQSLRLSVKALGDYTNTLKQLSPGTIAEVEGAFGRFTPTLYRGKEQVWIAGGIGITPFLSVARSFRRDYPNVTLFYSVKTRSELVDQEVLASYLPGLFPQFHFIPFVSDELGGQHLTAAFIQQHAGPLQHKEIFLCGPPPMMKALRKQLKGMGVPGRRIHDEAFAIS